MPPPAVSEQIRPLGSVLLALWLVLTTPLFSLLALLVSPLPPLVRYKVISWWSVLLAFAARLFCGIQHRVIGLENLPAAPCVLLSRHESAWETFAYQIIFPPHVTVLKKELLRLPFLGWGLAQMSPIAIDRQGGRQALRQVEEQGRQRLHNGFYVLVFPEGTRLAPGERQDYHIGGAWLAKKTGVVVLPVAVDSGKCWRKNAFFKRAGIITVRLGVPIIADECSVADINHQARQQIEEMMSVQSAEVTSDG